MYAIYLKSIYGPKAFYNAIKQAKQSDHIKIKNPSVAGLCALAHWLLYEP